MAIYKDLDVWQAAMSLVTVCYTATKKYPKEEMFGITSQLRRAAVSIPSNVSEGSCRKSDRAYLHHVAIALGSHAELETLIELSSRLGYLKTSDEAYMTKLCTKTGQLLNGLHRSLERQIPMTAK